MTFITAAAITLFVCALAMLSMGYKMAGKITLNPPIVTGLGFIIIACVFFAL